jgi:hypothetical protein
LGQFREMLYRCVVYNIVSATKGEKSHGVRRLNRAK